MNEKVQIFCGTGYLHYIALAKELSNSQIDVEIIGGVYKPNPFILKGLRYFLPKKINHKIDSIYSFTSSKLFRSNSTVMPESIVALAHVMNLRPSMEIWVRSFAMLVYRLIAIFYIKSNSLIVVRSGYCGRLFLRIAKLKGCRVIVDHSIGHPNTILSLENKSDKGFLHLFGLHIFWSIVRNSLYLASEIQVNSDYVYQDLKEDPILRSKKIRVNYLGVDYTDILEKKNCSFADLFSIRILFTGGFHYRKGADLCFALLKMLENDGINFKFEVFGIPDFNYKNIMIKEFGDKVIFHGHIPKPKLFRLLCEFDFYLFPTRCEGCASSVIEAMAAGLPVITSHQSGAPIEDGLNGILLKDLDIEHNFNKIKKLLNDENFRCNIGRNGALQVRSKLTWEMYLNNFRKWYI